VFAPLKDLDRPEPVVPSEARCQTAITVAPSSHRGKRLGGIDTKDDLNLYAYVYNDPTDRTDPTGNCPSCVGAALGAGLEVIVQLSTPEGRAAYSAAAAAVARGDVSGAVRAAGPELAKVAIAAVSGATGAGIATKVAEVAAVASKAIEASSAVKVAVNVATNATGNAVAGAGLGAASQAANNAVDGKPLSSGTTGAAVGGAIGGAVGSGITNGLNSSGQNLANATGNFIGSANGVAAPGANTVTAERVGAIVGAAAEKLSDTVLQ